ncbi:hypothetical protein AB4463_03160 [Vibrio cyclitrophicus]
MPIAAVSSTLATIKTAMEIGDVLIKAQGSYDKAQLKIEVERLVDSLHEVKKQVRTLDDVIYDQEQEIRELKGQLAAKKAVPKVGRYLDAVYKLDSNGWPTGNPYCLNCFAKNESLSPISPASIIPKITECGTCISSFPTTSAPKNVHKFLEQKKSRSDTFEPDVEILN